MSAPESGTTSETVRTRSMKKNLSLFLAMLRIGLFTFGGGYAMIALLEHEFTEKKKWLDRDGFLDMVAIAESTPGPIAINAATYIGYRTGGFLGSLAATVAVCIPSFIIIYVISLFFDAFLSLKLVAYAFRGIQVCVVYLVISAGIKLLRGMKPDKLATAIVAIVSACMVLFALLSVNFSSVLYIVISAVVGLAIYFVKSLKDRKEGAK